MVSGVTAVPPRSPHRVASTVAGVPVAVEAAAFLAASVSHAGVRVPLGVGVVAEPVIVPATIVEGLIAAGFAVAAWASFAGRPWRWQALVGAHGLSAGGVLLGIAALAAGGGPRTGSNDAFHRVMLTIAVVALVVLWTPQVRAALGRFGRGS
jgi:hypothetical protein